MRVERLYRLFPAFDSGEDALWIPPGGGSSARSTTLCTAPVGSGGFAGLARLVAHQPFDALRHEPGLPSPHPGWDFPERRMISAVLQPSAVAIMMLARHTCF
jgi:hypothetical protein